MKKQIKPIVKLDKKSAKPSGKTSAISVQRRRTGRKAEEEIPQEIKTMDQGFPTSNSLKNVLRILALLTVIGVTAYIYSLGDRVKDFAAYGYPGIFLIALLANATIFLPAPGVAVVFAMGSIFNPVGVAIAAGSGGALGELTGYLAGFSGQAVVDRTDIYNRFLPFIQKYGAWAILILAAIPNPFFDLAGFAAGATKIPLWRFLLFCWIGQLIKMAMFAYAGMYSITWITRLIH